MLKKQIDNIIKDISEKKKPVDKKIIAKKIEKITKQLNQSGSKIKRYLKQEEAEKWYCSTCQKKQAVELPRVIFHRNKESYYQAECTVCQNEILKKVRR